MKEKSKMGWNSNHYKIEKYSCIFLVALAVIALLLTEEEIFIVIAVICGAGVILLSELFEKQRAIECHYRTSEIRNKRIDVLTEQNQELTEQLRECKTDLIFEQHKRVSAERKIKRMSKFMEEAGILYVSSDTNRTNAISRNRRSKKTNSDKPEK